jgi:hypothetical protein
MILYKDVSLYGENMLKQPGPKIKSNFKIMRIRRRRRRRRKKQNLQKVQGRIT